MIEPATGSEVVVRYPADAAERAQSLPLPQYWPIPFQPIFLARMHVHQVHWPYAYVAQKFPGPCCPPNHASAAASSMPTTPAAPVEPIADDVAEPCLVPSP